MILVLLLQVDPLADNLPHQSSIGYNQTTPYNS